MNEQRYIHDKDIEFENSGIADKIEWEESEHIFTVKEVCDKLNEQQFIIEQLQEKNKELNDELEKFSAFIIEQREENKQLRQQLEIRTESDKYHQRMLRKWLCEDE